MAKSKQIGNAKKPSNKTGIGHSRETIDRLISEHEELTAHGRKPIVLEKKSEDEIIEEKQKQEEEYVKDYKQSLFNLYSSLTSNDGDFYRSLEAKIDSHENKEIEISDLIEPMPSEIKLMEYVHILTGQGINSSQLLRFIMDYHSIKIEARNIGQDLQGSNHVDREADYCKKVMSLAKKVEILHKRNQELEPMLQKLNPDIKILDVRNDFYRRMELGLSDGLIIYVHDHFHEIKKDDYAMMLEQEAKNETISKKRKNALLLCADFIRDYQEYIKQEKVVEKLVTKILNLEKKQNKPTNIRKIELEKNDNFNEHIGHYTRVKNKLKTIRKYLKSHRVNGKKIIYSRSLSQDPPVIACSVSEFLPETQKTFRDYLESFLLQKSYNKPHRIISGNKTDRNYSQRKT